jgi:hypothetical protein
MAGEAMAHVQASRLKVIAIVLTRFLNSPVTSSNVGDPFTLKRELQMNDYNFYADLLNKYSQLTPWVQALLGLSFFAAVLGVAYFIKETLALIMRPLQQQRPAADISEVKPAWRDKYYRDEKAQ